MTMEAPSQVIEYISKEVILNNSPLSYHKLSRKCKIPISKSKNLLYEYYEKNKEKLIATFITTGITENDKRLIKYSNNEDELEKDLKKFKEIFTIHIFCIIKNDLVLTKNEIAINELTTKSSFNEIKEYEKLGIIIGPEISELEIEEQRQQQSNIPSPKKQPPTLKREEKKEDKKSIKSAGLSSSYVSRKDQAKQQQQQKQQQKQTKTNSLKRSSTELDSKPTSTYQYKSRKAESKKPKERVIVYNIDDNNAKDGETDNDDDDNANDNELKKKQTTPSTTNLEDIFNEDDDFEFSDEEENNNQKEEVINESETVDEQEQKEETEQNHDQKDEEPELFVTEEPEEEEEEKQEEEPELIEEVDEEGYTITKRKPRSVTKPQKQKFKPKAINKMVPPKQPKKSNDSAANKKKTQSSLMSFFGKK